jgi:hypothetical protein
MEFEIELEAVKWPRFSEYQLVNPALAAAADAISETYFPWRAYLAAREDGLSQRGPHEELLRLVSDLRFTIRSRDGGYELDAPSVEALLRWCSRHGLLGVGFPSLGEAGSKPKWPKYEESVEDFLDAVLELRDTMAPFVDYAVWGEEESLELLGALELRALRPMSSAFADSTLIELCWAMAFQDALAAGFPRICQHCDSLFLTRSRQAKYCTGRCRETAQKQAHRKSLRKRDGG